MTFFIVWERRTWQNQFSYLESASKINITSNSYSLSYSTQQPSLNCIIIETAYKFLVTRILVTGMKLLSQKLRDTKNYMKSTLTLRGWLRKLPFIENFCRVILPTSNEWHLQQVRNDFISSDLEKKWSFLFKISLNVSK